MTNNVVIDVLTNEEAITQLNRLIETCKDGQLGFSTAAEDVKNVDMKVAFAKYAAQRTVFLGELRGLITVLGGDPEKGGSVVGAIHRGWINLKSAIASGDENAILAECERGDASAVETYKSVLDMNLPQSVKALADKQHTSIRNALDEIRSFVAVAAKK